MRIGVFGGSFDPPHSAHVALVRTAMFTLALDELHVIPTGQAWHKARQLSPAHHRLAMAELAFAGLPGIVIDPIEIQRVGPSYTIDTLRELRAQWPDAEFFLIIGADQARALPTWREWEEIVRLAIICVAGRGDSTRAGAQFVAPKAQESRFRRLPMPDMPFSSTDIRAQVAARHSVVPLVFEPVARYIDHHHLYQTL
jgi:nicotinate-nucleotide adenylyltransferase